ncbi:uncharacterized protein TRIADDRAFT_25814 [Trichoplax adhaerens]|uniref:isoleucine--tRNA ligase n=1 Tax=Trichoplax adhaerens TaxID=10228 RepID=B3RWY6_TRIAD|nr:hypothetical protein TRIADDRAFT_25814 [Trichoplax adhaerens]EDV24777.1 hypothetical protein TRIADDRAFT_25814 [Trichoplax adhaerens]|eukprot:XP_002112667.1 hypothetical protein TRIADDRAFT_25814 [Trichoplax adhaerens]
MADSEQFSFPSEEKKVLSFWKQIDAFQSCLRQSKDKPRYTFYDGPPFATGLPHYGHILAGTIKDIVTRYAHQSGFHVIRRFGWDCHGLPIEYEIDKQLGIKGPDDVAKMGIKAYNDECRKIVMRYSSEWQTIVTRLGRWIDFDHDYKTLYPWYMESIWWVFKQIYSKGLVYHGYKVMPFSTACNTPLSNFESGQNYKDVNDPAVIVSFPLDEDPNIRIIAWTTTPWTLPSNLALCVNAKLDYVKIRDNATENVYIMMEARLGTLYKTDKEYTILDRFTGDALQGKTYKPLFPYFESMKEQGAFVIYCDDYVTDDSGTGVVHQAPFFGEDDYRAAMNFGVIKKGGKVVCPVDPSGKFTDEVPDFQGLHVKDADKLIIKKLKELGRLVHQSVCKHSYPFCWRSDTPLIYKAVPSWFIRVEDIIDGLLKNNAKCYWYGVPEFVKEKRFYNWLKGACDWNFSRNRYWGTPIPLWVSEDMQEVVCVGSIDELEKLSGVRLTDLHRENVDKVTIPSKTGKGVLRRITEVFDCWFESGSMPYAQNHYPFENKEDFESCFPADFIAEGIDQTRGWFYTLLVISVAMFDKPPYKNLIVNGLVLAADGRKMSKRLKNYPNPEIIVSNYGADALRLYLINSPVVRGETLKFQERGVKDIIKDVFLPWLNAFRFLSQNIKQWEQTNGGKFVFNENTFSGSENSKDKWILSFTQSLNQFVRKEMEAYRLYTVIPRLVRYFDQLTNWYIRFNRKRIKGEADQSSCHSALQTLYSVIYTINRLMASFTPFFTEHIHQNMRQWLAVESIKDINTDSVHFLMIPQVKESLIDHEIERSVARMQAVIELGRVIRDRKALPIKYPLPELIVIHKEKQYLNDVLSLQDYILEELNVRDLVLSSEKEKYGIRLRAEPDNQLLGKRLKGSFKTVSAAIKELKDHDIAELQEKGELVVNGHTVTIDEIKIAYTVDKEHKIDETAYEAHSDNDVLVLINVTPDETMLNEGFAREVVNRIQKLRKKAGLQPSNDVTVFYETPKSNEENQSFLKVITEYKNYIENAIKQPVTHGFARSDDNIIIQDTEVKV